MAQAALEMTLGIMNTARTNFQPFSFWASRKPTSVPMPTCSVMAINDHQNRFFSDGMKPRILNSWRKLTKGFDISNFGELKPSHLVKAVNST